MKLKSTFLFVLVALSACSKNSTNDFDPDLEIGGSSTGGTTSGTSTGGSTTSGTSGSSSSGETTGESDSGSDSGSSSGTDDGTGFPTHGSFDMSDLLTPGEFTGGMGGNGSSSSGEESSGSGSAGNTSGETSGSTSEGSSGDTSGGPTEAAEVDVPKDWGMAGLWRGMRVEFTDSGCANHQIHSVGQYINENEAEGYWDNDNSSGELHLSLTTNFQSEEKAKKSKPYKYRSYYTYLAYNPHYIRIYEGKYVASDRDGNLDSYDTSVDITEVLKDFPTPSDQRKVHVVIQGANFKFDDKSDKVSILDAGIDSARWNDSNPNQVDITFNAAFSNGDGKNSTITIYYAILVVNKLYVQSVDSSYYFSYECGSSCTGFLDYSLNALDPEIFNTDDSVFFTANHQWGSTVSSFESLNLESDGSYYGGGGVGSNGPNPPVKINSVRGYSSVKDENNPSRITINGEVYNQACADSEEVFLMDEITPTLFVCMDDRICKAQQGWLDWKNVDPSDDETATDTYIIEKTSFDF